jgi:uncharacterized membrane protein YfcA
MSAPGIAAIRRAPPWGVVTGLGLLACIALWFIQERARRYAAYDAIAYGDLWPRRGGFIPHMAGGLIAISVGLVQLWLGLTGRTGTLHRILGRTYLGGVTLGSAGGFYLALTIDPKYFAYAVGLFLLCTAWVMTTAMAYVAIRRGAIDQHREWMIRSYTVTFAFVTFRLVERLLMHWHVAADDEIDAMIAWGCWSVPLLFIEPLLQLKRMGRAATG